MWWDCLSQTVQSCHLLAVGYGKRYDETAFHRMCSFDTHLLLVTVIQMMIGEDVMRLLLQKVQCYSLPEFGDMKRCDKNAFHKNLHDVAYTLSAIGKKYIEQLFWNICNVTYILLVTIIGSFLSSFELTNQHDMPLTFCYRKRCDFAAFHKLAISLTICRTKECVQMVL